MNTASPAKKRRIIEFDLLRGFFILVILIDHLQRWPTPLSAISGAGRLWVSAAEGFFLISGLLIGYLRIYKDRDKPLKEVSIKLVKRAGILYLWGIGITLLMVACMTIFVTEYNSNLFNRMPSFEVANTMSSYLWNVFTMNYTADWIYFLRLYAIMLLVAPLVVWLLRRFPWWVCASISLTIYLISISNPAFNEGALQWQFLFFGAAIIGSRFEQIVTFFRQRPVLKRLFATTFIGVTAVTILTSFAFVHGTESSFGIFEPLRSLDYDNINRLFRNDPMTILRVTLAFTWFVGAVCFVHYAKGWIKRYFGWLLLTFGPSSLSAYCLQAICLVLLQSFFPQSDSRLINLLYGIGFIMLIWGILKFRPIRRWLPT